MSPKKYQGFAKGIMRIKAVAWKNFGSYFHAYGIRMYDTTYSKRRMLPPTALTVLQEEKSMNTGANTRFVLNTRSSDEYSQFFERIPCSDARIRASTSSEESSAFKNL